MKAIIVIFTMVLMSFTLNAQKAFRVEDHLDSIQTVEYRALTKNCQKYNVRYGLKNNISCPVFQDNDGIVFYINIENKKPKKYMLDDVAAF